MAFSLKGIWERYLVLGGEKDDEKEKIAKEKKQKKKNSETFYFSFTFGDTVVGFLVLVKTK